MPHPSLVVHSRADPRTSRFRSHFLTAMDHAILPPFITILTDGGKAGLELAIWSNLLIVQVRPWEVRWFMQQISDGIRSRAHPQYVLSPVKVLRMMMSIPSYQSFPIGPPNTSRCLCVLFHYLDDSCVWGMFLSHASQTEPDVQVNHVRIWLKYRFWFRKPCKSQNILEEFKNKIK